MTHPHPPTARRAARPRGTGSLAARRDKAGRETWYVSFYVAGRRVRRRVGPKREPGTSRGLTKSQAEAEVRRLMDHAATERVVVERLTLHDAGERYLAHLETLGRRESTLQDYRTCQRRLAGFFAGRALDRIRPEDVEDLIGFLQRDLAPNTVRNHLNVLGAVFGHAVKRGWSATNPMDRVDRPRPGPVNDDVRYLDEGELEALLRAARNDYLGHIDRVLWLTAAMTGLRRGELLALRWRDVDWAAGLIRVRRGLQRGGSIGAPKTRRGSRATPMPNRVAGALDQHHGASPWQGDDDLVFAHPATGRVYDPARVYKRYKQGLRDAGLRDLRFHDLRHTFGVRMAAAGAPMRHIQGWMGHASVTTTEIYADFSPDPMQAAEWAARAFGSGPDVARADAGYTASRS